jgi:hypothetical protein
MIEQPSRLGGLPAWIHAFVWSMLIGLTLALLGVSRTYERQHVWDGWRESSDLFHSRYAERIRVGDVFRTRANTWSNLAYVLVGFYGIAIGYHDLRRPRPADSNYLVQTPAMSLLFGAACCGLGFGSGFFHASLTRVGQQLDVGSMYAPLLVLIALNLGRWMPHVSFGGRHRSLPTWPILGSLAVVASLLLFKYKWSMSSRTVLSTLIAAVSVCGVLDRFQASRKMAIHWLVLAGAALAASVLCRELDVAARFTGPDAWLQGHALWHILTALCLGCMYLYYRSEVVPNQLWERETPLA